MTQAADLSGLDLHSVGQLEARDRLNKGGPSASPVSSPRTLGDASKSADALPGCVAQQSTRDDIVTTVSAYGSTWELFCSEVQSLVADSDLKLFALQRSSETSVAARECASRRDIFPLPISAPDSVGPNIEILVQLIRYVRLVVAIHISQCGAPCNVWQLMTNPGAQG